MGTVLRPVVMRSDLEGHRPATSLELHIAGDPPSSLPLGLAVTLALLAMAGLQQAANGRTRRAGTLLATAAVTALVTLIGATLAVTTADLVLVAALAAGIAIDLWGTARRGTRDADAGGATT